MSGRRRVVLATWGSYGDLYPFIGLGRALRARGLDVVLASPAYYRSLAAQEGLPFHPVGPDVDPDDKARIARVVDPIRGTEAIVREWLMPAVRRSYEELEALVSAGDLLVTHPVTFAAPVLAERLRIPWVSTVLSPLSFFSAFDLPIISGAPSWMARLRRAGPWYGRLVRALARRATQAWAAPVYELRAAEGLARGGHPLFEGQFSPDLTLALFSRVMAAPQPDWPQHVKMPGFIFYNAADPLPPDLEAFLDAGPPPVVFTLGSSAVIAAAAGPFYEESASAARRAGVRAVLLSGPNPDNRPSPRHADVLCVDHAPHDRLFPRASMVVHHGGIGTTGQALRAGRPMLVVPHANDQPDNADRVRRLGVSRTLLPSAFRSERVAGEIGALLTDERHAARAAAAARVIGGEEAAEGAAAAIDALASR